ncbi:hypothetical protein A7J08_10430 (plasmid) [Streptococcus suis]|uniref:Uncharacterized protein n=2 Tax=Streptococcus suis TaxID=1307 RepID=A0A3Q8BK77_STRSU|nr:hypothetical protein A7J08_10045 [Streptococcus suis]KPA71496.1 hypothetical protein WQ51_08405 [Streptococcus suis]
MAFAGFQPFTATKNAEGTIRDFPDNQEAAPLPEANDSQPLNDLSPDQTQPQPLTKIKRGPMVVWGLYSPKLKAVPHPCHLMTPLSKLLPVTRRYPLIKQYGRFTPQSRFFRR